MVISLNSAQSAPIGCPGLCVEPRGGVLHCQACRGFCISVCVHVHVCMVCVCVCVCE